MVIEKYILSSVTDFSLVNTLEIRYSPHPKPYRTLSRHTAFKSFGLGWLTHDRNRFGEFKEVQFFLHTGLQVKLSCNFLNNDSFSNWCISLWHWA